MQLGRLVVAVSLACVRDNMDMHRVLMCDGLNLID